MHATAHYLNGEKAMGRSILLCGTEPAAGDSIGERATIILLNTRIHTTQLLFVSVGGNAVLLVRHLKLFRVQEV